MEFFKSGTKVKVDNKLENFSDGPGVCSEMRNYCGKTVTIKNANKIDLFCKIKEDGGKFLWDYRWFNTGNLVTITFDPSKADEAYKMVEEAIEKYKESKNWTRDEIEQAKILVCDMSADIIGNSGNVFFSLNTQDNSITCTVFPNWSIRYNSFTSCTKPTGEDVYNPWIGKCVVLCKLLNKPIPSFIKNKNR